jgi:hypothetical protein
MRTTLISEQKKWNCNNMKKLILIFLFLSFYACGTPEKKNKPINYTYDNRELDSVEKVIYQTSYIKELPYPPIVLARIIPKDEKDSITFELGYDSDVIKLSKMNFYYYRTTKQLKYHNVFMDTIIVIR